MVSSPISANDPEQPFVTACPPRTSGLPVRYRQAPFLLIEVLGLPIHLCAYAHTSYIGAVIRTPFNF
jgi:hypothetical protein